jgi:hypothetical protein
MGLPKTHTFNGVKYQLILEKLDGLCVTECSDYLVVERDLKTRVGLETMIHEALHACAWSASEKKIDQTARDTARLLWRLGYRLRQEKK